MMDNTTSTQKLKHTREKFAFIVAFIHLYYFSHISVCCFKNDIQIFKGIEVWGDLVTKH